MTTDLAQYDNSCWEFFSQVTPDGFEKAECPMGCKSFTPLFTKKMMQVVRCECGLIYNRYQPTKETLDKFYTESDALKKWSEIKCNPCEDIRQVNKFGKAIDFIRHNSEADDIGAALDIGCGTGFYLRMLQEVFPDCFMVGIDQSEESIEKAKSQGLRNGVYNNVDYLDLKFTKGAQEIVSLWGVLEHLKNPLTTLKKIADTKPKFLICCVPNMDALVIEHLWEYCSTFVPQHLWYFNHKTLSSIYASIGYEVAYSYTVESEIVPIERRKLGYHPYDNSIGINASDAKRNQIIQDNRGYKIIVVGTPCT